MKTEIKEIIISCAVTENGMSNATLSGFEDMSGMQIIMATKHIQFLLDEQIKAKGFLKKSDKYYMIWYEEKRHEVEIVGGELINSVAISTGRKLIDHHPLDWETGNSGIHYGEDGANLAVIYTVTNWQPVTHEDYTFYFDKI